MINQILELFQNKKEHVEEITSQLGVLGGSLLREQYIEDTKYIPKELWSDILVKDKVNTRVIKASTGSGATYGLMQCTGFNRIIVMPTVKLIQDKERQAKEGHFEGSYVFALYGGSDDRIERAIELENGSTVVLTTPDQLVIIYETKRDIWDKIINWSIVLDEYHMITQSGSFRDVMGKVDYLLHDWKGTIATITATEPFTSTLLLKTFDTVVIKNELQKRNKVGVTRDESTAWYYFNKWYEAGDKIVVVSNDLKKYVTLAEQTNELYRMTGSNLDIKLTYHKFKSVRNDRYEDEQVTMISSSATEGIDLDFEAHVLVLSDYTQEPTGFSLQSIIQSLGRPREGLLESVILTKYNASTLEKASEPVLSDEEEIQESCDMLKHTKEKYKTIPSKVEDKLSSSDDFVKVGNEWVVNEPCVCSFIEHQQTIKMLFSDDWIRQCNNYLLHTNCFLYPLEEEIFEIPKPPKGQTTGERIQHYMTFSEADRDAFLFKTRFEMRQGNTGTFNPGLFGCLLAAQVLLKIDDSDATKRVCAKKEIGRVYNLLNNIVFGSVTQRIEQEKAQEKEQTDSKGVCKNSSFYIKPEIPHPFVSSHGLHPSAITQHKTNYGHYDVSAVSQVEINMVQIFYFLCQLPDYTKDKISEHLTERRAKKRELDIERLHLVWMDEVKKLGALLLNDFHPDRINVKSTREYSAITSLPMDLIADVVPYDVVELDISVANPSFVDDLVGSDIGQIVYSTIMEKDNKSRDDAKVIYNMTLNSIDSDIPDRTRKGMLVSWGYTEEQADIIIESSQEKGQLFYKMTAVEKQVIDDMLKVMQISRSMKVVRRHDSLILMGRQEKLERSLIKFEQDYVCPENIHYHVNKWYE